MRLRQRTSGHSTLEALWIDRFAVSANSWSSWARCLEPLPASPSPCSSSTPNPAAVAEPEHERPAVLAASPPSRQPPASQTARSEDLGDGSDSSAQQRAASAGRAAQRDGKADKNGESRKNKAGGSGKDKAGKGNDK
jgi:hypothetical protein